MRKTQPKVIKFSRKKLAKEIMQEARVLEIHSGAAEILAETVATSVEAWAKKRTMITQADLDRAVARELKKYNADLAYVYQNRGKII